MNRNLCLVGNPTALRNKLAQDMIANSGFIHRVFLRNEKFSICATPDLNAAVAFQEGRNHLIFCGDWSDTELPMELLPRDNFFVSASPPEAIDMLRTQYEVTGEWPCWHFLAPRNFGPGPWDEVGPLKLDEIPSISKYWTLSECPEREMTERVKKYDSACVRENGVPVSWCGLHFENGGIGNMGFAHTIEEHRRKGYASLVTKALVNRLDARGSRATVHVIKENLGSIGLCKSMNFQVIGELSWAEFGKKI